MEKKGKEMLVAMAEIENIFKVKFPLTRYEFTEAYRRMPEWHPDYANQKKAQAIFEIYLDVCDTKSFHFFSDINPVTVDGITISELGKGFPEHRRTTNCFDCHGEGYTTKTLRVWLDCPDCNGKGTRHKTETCQACGGKKEYKLYGRAGTVSCLHCNGSGRKKFQEQEPCPTCGEKGGKLYVAKGLKSYHKCSSCNGAGRKPAKNTQFSRKLEAAIQTAAH